MIHANYDIYISNTIYKVYLQDWYSLMAALIIW